MKVQIRHLHESLQAEKGDGYRVLVDRLWPRGIRKADLEFDAWEREIAPTPELRKWFGHDPARWDEFRHRYQRELDTPECQRRLKEILDAAGKRKLTLLYAARDPEHNHAVVLASALERLY